MFFEVLTLIGSLLLIVLILVFTWYATRWYARRMGQSVSGKYIQILDRSQLAGGSILAVVQVGEKYYLIGIGEKSVNMLCELENFEPAQLSPAAEPPAFSGAFRDVLEKIRKGGDHRP